jgi:hypothetical protein
VLKHFVHHVYYGWGKQFEGATSGTSLNHEDVITSYLLHISMVMMVVMSCNCNGVSNCCEGMKEEKNYVTVEIKWDRECLREGDSETSWD